MIKGSYVKIQNGKAIHIKYVTLFGRRYVYSGAPFEMRINKPKLTFSHQAQRYMDAILDVLLKVLGALVAFMLVMFIIMRYWN